MRNDPDYFDAKIAGWWVWGQCLWIGGGWCQNRTTSATPDTNGRPSLSFQNGVIQKSLRNGRGSATMHAKGLNCKRVKLSGLGVGVGVHSEGPGEQLPDISGEGGASGRGIHGSGVRERLPDISGNHGAANGRGIMKAEWSQRPALSEGDRGCENRREFLLEWFKLLQDRFRNVRVCCGHWKRVCNSPSVTTRIGLTGLFLDPPYKGEVDGETSRDDRLYAEENLHIADEVREYCLERGADRLMRIALCGLAGEHDELEKHGWSVVHWKSHGGYGNRSGGKNRVRERIWFSPHCLSEDDLFSEGSR